MMITPSFDGGITWSRYLVMLNISDKIYKQNCKKTMLSTHACWFNHVSIMLNHYKSAGESSAFIFFHGWQQWSTTEAIVMWSHRLWGRKWCPRSFFDGENPWEKSWDNQGLLFGMFWRKISKMCVCVCFVCVCFHQQIKIDFDRPGITEPDNLGKSWENGWKTHKGQMMEFKPTPFFGNPWKKNMGKSREDHRTKWRFIAGKIFEF